MFHINENFLNLTESYLFAEVAKRVAEFSSAHPGKKVIRMGIGDVTRPLAPGVIRALHAAVEDMAAAATFKGYSPDQGYVFLREGIAGYYASKYSVTLEPGEIFVSDGAKSDVGNITDILAQNNVVGIPDPVYPVYADSNIMNGRKLVYLDATEGNGFLPMPDELREEADVIYLCSPNNPTGAAYSREQLTAWVDYALAQEALILFDAAYEAFISEPGLPGSIYEIDGAKKCAIEFCSFSKTAGFTGTRCGYTVVPYELEAKTSGGGKVGLHKLWFRRQSTKFNGTPYIVQKAAAAVFTPEGQREAKETIDYYRGNAKIMGEALTQLGIKFFGGVNSPYIWMKCPKGMKSWEFFDYLLNEAAVVGTPGGGFGKNGDNYFRLTAFGERENAAEGMERLKRLLR